jgi:hypothetical protein
MEEKKYKIELTEKEAGNFLMWREYQDLWERLPFFRCQTLELNINSSGKIVRACIIFNREKQEIFLNKNENLTKKKTL